MVSTSTPAARTTPRAAGRAPVLLALLAAVALLGVLFAGVAHRRALDDGPGVNRIGAAAAIQPRPAPEFALGGRDGRPFRLADQRGKVVVVNFWASWCPPCRDEAAAFEHAWQGQQGDAGDVVFVGINLWDQPAAAEQFLQQFATSYPIVTDKNGETAIAYGVRGLPETFFIDRAGQLVRKWIGPMSEQQLEATLDALAGTGS